MNLFLFQKVTTISTSSGGGSSSSATKTSPIKRKTTSDDDDEILVNNNSNNKKIIVSSNNSSANSNNNIRKRESAKQQQNKNNRAKDFVDDGSWIVVSKNDKKQRQINQNLILNEMAANLFQKSSATNGESKVNVTAIVAPQSPAKGNSNKKVNLKTKELKEKANQKQKELEKFSDSNNSDDAPIIVVPAAANNNSLNDKLNSNTSTPVVVDNKILDDVISDVTETPDILDDKVEPNVVTKKNQLITTTASTKEKALNSKNDAKTAIKNKEADEKQLNSSEEPASIEVDDIGGKHIIKGSFSWH